MFTYEGILLKFLIYLVRATGEGSETSLFGK